jgi:hypothetical protein
VNRGHGSGGGTCRGDLGTNVRVGGACVDPGMGMLQQHTGSE